MFGGIEDKIRRHAVSELIEKLGKDGTTSIEGIGTFTYTGDGIAFREDPELLEKVREAAEVAHRIKRGR